MYERLNVVDIVLISLKGVGSSCFMNVVTEFQVHFLLESCVQDIGLPRILSERLLCVSPIKEVGVLEKGS